MKIAYVDYFASGKLNGYERKFGTPLFYEIKMRTRTYEIKDSTGTVIETDMMGWWNNTINLADLAPHPTLGISGMVSARGGWCKIGKWFNPENPNTLQCSAARWATLVAEKLTASGHPCGAGNVIDAIAGTLEVLEDERLNPPIPYHHQNHQWNNI